MLELDVKKKIIIGCVLGIGIFFAGRFSNPSKIETHKELTIKNEVSKQSDKQKNNIVTRKKVIKKDGTIEFTKTIDHSVKDKSKDIVKNESKKIEDKKVEYNQPNWNVRALYEVYPTLPMVFDYKKVYIGVDYRVFGNVFVYTQFNLQPSVMVGIGFSF